MWQETMRALLDEARNVPVDDTGDLGIYWAAEPIEVHGLLARLAKTEEDFADFDQDAEDYDPGNLGSASAILNDLGAVRTVLDFEWHSGGPMVWFATLDLLDLGAARCYVCRYDEIQPYAYCVIAALASARAFPTFLDEYMAGEGCEYGEELMSHLPTITEIKMPDIITEEEVRDSFRSFAESAASEDEDGGMDGGVDGIDADAAKIVVSKRA